MKKELNKFEKYRDLILAEHKKDNIVFSSINIPQVVNLDKFLTQHIDGILYDLNRSEEVVLTFIEDEKWINDYAVCKVIRRLKEQNDKLREELKKYD